MKSETIGALAEALSKAQGKMKGAVKDIENPYFKSKYADLSAVWEACRDVLAENKLAVVQTFERSEGDLAVIIKTTLIHSTGEWIDSELVLKPVKNDPQGIGSAITYGRRYALAAIVGVTQEDNDAESNKLPDIQVTKKEAVKSGMISEAQRKRLYAIYTEAGKTNDDVKRYLKEVHNIETSKDIPWKLYDEICEWAGDKETTPTESERAFDQDTQ